MGKDFCRETQNTYVRESSRVDHRLWNQFYHSYPLTLYLKRNDTVNNFIKILKLINSTFLTCHGKIDTYKTINPPTFNWYTLRTSTQRLYNSYDFFFFMSSSFVSTPFDVGSLSYGDLWLVTCWRPKQPVVKPYKPVSKAFLLSGLVTIILQIL